MFNPRFIRHSAEEILRLEFSGLRRPDLLAAFDTAGRLIRKHPLNSLRILTVLRSDFDVHTVEALKRYALLNRPHVRASAVVGTCFWNVIVTSLQMSGREDLAVFDDERSALDWLAGLGGSGRSELS